MGFHELELSVGTLEGLSTWPNTTKKTSLLDFYPNGMLMSVSWLHSFFLYSFTNKLGGKKKQIVGVITDDWINPNCFVDEEMTQSRMRRGDLARFTPEGLC